MVIGISLMSIGVVPSSFEKSNTFLVSWGCLLGS